MGNLPKIKDRALEIGVRRHRPAGRVRRGRAQGPGGRPARPLSSALPAGQRHRPRAISSASPSRSSRPRPRPRSSRPSVDQRILKSKEEVREIECAVAVSHEMYLAAMKLAKPGRYEYQISGAMEGIALAYGMHLAFPPIVTINGQTLHMHYHDNLSGQGAPSGHRLRGGSLERLRLRHHPDASPSAAASTPGRRTSTRSSWPDRNRPSRPSSPASISRTSISRRPGSWPTA